MSKNQEILCVKWRSPANIALIKYWGKMEHQIPANPSISFTLDQSFTETSITLLEKATSQEIELDFFFEGSANHLFKKKIENFLNTRIQTFPFLKEYKLVIHSINSFPHSAGIASSASSMSALVLGLCDIEMQISNRAKGYDNLFFQKCSEEARLASGSASRSVYGGLVTWGKINGLPYTSNQYASPLQGNIAADFLDFQDAVLVVSSKEKVTSSRAGHSLMNHHPYSAARYKNANENIVQLITAINEKNLESFIDIVEFEALNLHGLMMTSQPSVLLLFPESLQIIHEIRNFRKKTGLPLCFTIDAGPNIHLLYPKSIKKEVNLFIENDLSQFCESKHWIADNVGSGPIKLE